MRGKQRTVAPAVCVRISSGSNSIAFWPILVLSRSERLSRFQRYTVEETLSGNGDELKEYTIALEVYNKAPSYDPAVDSVVRVEVRRLRTKLSDYYENTARDDPIRIEFPKGYVPVFTKQVSLEKDVADATPTGRVELPVRTAFPVRRFAAPILILVTLLIVAAGSYLVIVRTTSPSATDVLSSIAVLPFVSFSPELGRRGLRGGTDTGRDECLVADARVARCGALGCFGAEYNNR